MAKKKLPDLSEFPGTVVKRVIDLLDDNQFTGRFHREPEIGMYVGEFVSGKQMKDLTSRVKTRPELLVDFEDAFPRTSRGERPTTALESDNQLMVYCCTSNRRAETEQMIHALTVASWCRSWIVGKEMPAQAEVHNNGFFEDEGVHRQFHGEGISVYSFDTSLALTEQLIQLP